MNWHDVAPRVVANAQKRWEFQQTLARMRGVGFSKAECARRLGISTTTVDYHLFKLERQAKKKPALGAGSPIEEWMAETADLRWMAARLMAEPPQPLTPTERMAKKLRAAGWTVTPPPATRG